MIPALLFSSKISIPENVASNNIALELIKLGFGQKNESEWEFGNAKLIDTKFDRSLNVPTGFGADYFIVLSPHKSDAKLQSLTVHIPGNWDSADHGGNPRSLNIAYASMQKSLLQKMHWTNNKYGLNFNVNFEVDHHGPTPWAAGVGSITNNGVSSSQSPVSATRRGKPIIFVEIGSSELEWKNPLAAKVIAEAVFETITEGESKTENPGPETFFGVGGGHYAPVFTKYAIEKDMAFGHMLPKYKADAIAEDTFRQAIEKNLESVTAILLDKKGVNKAQREKIEKLASEFGIEIKRI